MPTPVTRPNKFGRVVSFSDVRSRWCGALAALVMLALAGSWTSAWASALSNGVAIEAAVDKEKVTVGDLIEYTVTYTYPADMQVTLPVMGANLGNFVIRDFTIDEADLPEGTTRISRNYTIAAYFTGDREIPAETVTFRRPDGGTGQARGPAITIVVESVASDQEEGLRGPKEAREVPYDPTRLYRGLAILGGAILLLGLLLNFVRRWLNRPVPVVEPPTRPAHEVALEALAELRAMPIESHLDTKQFYFRLSEVLRAYTGRLYNVHLMEKTTEEARRDLRKTEMPQGHFRTVLGLLSEFDIVKFADYTPPATERTSHLDGVERFVRETMLRFQPSPAAAAEAVSAEPTSPTSTTPEDEA